MACEICGLAPKDFRGKGPAFLFAPFPSTSYWASFIASLRLRGRWNECVEPGPELKGQELLHRPLWPWRDHRMFQSRPGTAIEWFS
jgi:hypothetical protein